MIISYDGTVTPEINDAVFRKSYISLYNTLLLNMYFIFSNMYIE